MQKKKHNSQGLHRKHVIPLFYRNIHNSEAIDPVANLLKA